jgi:hypothetical protein
LYHAFALIKKIKKLELKQTGVRLCDSQKKFQPVRNNPMRPAPVIAAIIFIIIAILQAIRYFYNLDVTINGTIIPMWVSLFGIAIPLIMAIWLLFDGGEETASKGPDSHSHA